MLVMPELAFTAMRTSSTKVVTAKPRPSGEVALLVVRAALDVDGAVLHQRDAVLRVTGWYFTSSLASQATSAVGQHAAADLDVEASVLAVVAVAQTPTTRARPS